MTEPTSQNRLIGRLLLGAAALALPLTASITYAAQDAPAPPAPPEAPAAPEAPVIKKTAKVVIIDNPAGSKIDDKDLHTRVIEKDGKTIVLKTTKPLSDAEVDQHVAKAMSSMAEAEHMASMDQASASWTAHDAAAKTHKIVMIERVNAEGKAADAKATERREVRTFVMHGDGKGGDLTNTRISTAIAAADCGGAKPIEATSESTVDGKRQVSHVVICNKGGDKSHALAGLKKARDRVSSDPNISGEIKAEVLKQLDAEIAKLN